MNGNRNISSTTEQHRPEAIIVPFQPPYFLQKKLHFYLLLAVIGTTLLSWFNINSWLIIFLAGCRLFDGRPAVAIRTAFSNQWFLAYFSLFLLEVTGLFHTHDLVAGWKHVEGKATLVAIPFILCGGPFTDRNGWRRLWHAYCLLLAGLCLFCLVASFWSFARTGDPSVFFYHQLTEILDSNAVFFSGYVLMALLWLLADRAPAGNGRIVLILFFIGMMVLLASKLLLVMLAITLFIYLVIRYRFRVQRWRFVVLAVPVVLGIGMLAFTNNPVQRRYGELVEDDLNGVSFRLFIWQRATDILSEKHAWIFGVSAGDCRDLLNQKYLEAGMSHGYIGYNCQNQYVEILLRSGVTGLCILLIATGSLIRMAARKATIECWLAVAMIILLSFTESTLEMQQPAFLSCFFPLLFWWAPRRKMAPPAQPSFAL